MNAIKSLLTGCLLAAAAYGSPVLSAPQTGWYWNPAESGRGFFFESRDGATFIGAYGYEADGHATWLVAGGPNDDPYNYSGDLYSKSNGQTLFGTYVAPVGPNTAGTISVHFRDDTHGTVTWPGGTVAIERQIFGGENEELTPFSGWWWNPEEGGSGYTLEIQGNNLFVVGFMYDTDGRPVWYFSAGPMGSSTTYQGSLLQFANGQTPGGPYHPPDAPVRIGTLGIEFTEIDEATLTFTDAGSSPSSAMRLKEGKTRTTKGVPQLPTKFRFPVYYSAKFELDQQWPGSVGFLEGTVTYSGDIPTLEIGPSGKKGVSLYSATTGTITVVVDLNSPALHCHTYGVQVFTKATLLLPKAVQLEVSPYGYALKLHFQSLHLTVPVTVKCQIPGVGDVTSSSTVELPLWSTLDGTITNSFMDLGPPIPVEMPEAGSFYFVGSPRKLYEPGGWYNFRAHY